MARGLGAVFMEMDPLAPRIMPAEANGAVRLSVPVLIMRRVDLAVRVCQVTATKSMGRSAATTPTCVGR